MNFQQQSARLRPFRPVPFGRYTLLTPLSMGGMGEIFLARFEGAQGFEKLCVIKKILPSLARDPEFVERFVNEAKILVKLSHGSIAQVLDVGLHEGDPYMALEYVDGKDLRKIAARSRDRNLPLPLTLVLHVMGRVLDALAYAHRKRDDDEREIGLVHRDVSPQNILISYEGEVKVIDFGLAKSALSSAKTNPSMILGKFLYMSPEQARHQKVDRRADLYSAGLCLYELVCGKNPFDDVPPHELMVRVASPNIPPIHTVDPLCPAPVQEMVARALEVDPSKRFQSAEEFRGKIQACLLEIDPSAGPESVTRYMRDAFAAEFQQERKLLASLKAIARPVEDAETPKREEKKRNEHETAVFSLKTVAPTEQAAKAFTEAPAARAVTVEKPIEPVPLSFNPTPRTREGIDELPPDGETVPGVLVTEELRKATMIGAEGEPARDTPWVDRADHEGEFPDTQTGDLLLPPLELLERGSGTPTAQVPLASVAVSPSMMVQAQQLGAPPAPPVLAPAAAHAPTAHAPAAHAPAFGPVAGAPPPSAAPRPVSPPPEDTQPRVVIGTLLEDPPVLPPPQGRVRPPVRPAQPPPSAPAHPASVHGEARGAVRARSHQTDEVPLSDAADAPDLLADPVTADLAIADEDTGVRKIPRRDSGASGFRAVRWLAVAMVGIALAAAGYVGWEQLGKPLLSPQPERVETLPSDPKPLVPPPQRLGPPGGRGPAAAPELVPAGANTAGITVPANALAPAEAAADAATGPEIAPAAAETAAPAAPDTTDDLLEPLEVRIATAAPDPVPAETARPTPAPSKRVSSKKSKLFRDVTAEWSDTQRAFKALQRRHSCEVRQMRLICGQAALLEDQMSALQDDAEELNRIRGHLRKLRQDIDKLSRKGR